MALGDFQDSAVQSGVGASDTVTFSSTPDVGNLIVIAGVNVSNNPPLSAPTGYTIIEQSGTPPSWCNDRVDYFYKVSEGDETSETLTWSSSNSYTILQAEYEWDGSTPTVLSNKSSSTSSTETVSTIQPGSVTPGGTPNIVIAMVSTTYSTGANPPTISVDFTVDADSGAINEPGLTFASKVSAEGATNPTFTEKNPVSNRLTWAAIASFQTGTSVPTVTFSDANGNSDFIDLNDQAVSTTVDWEVYSGHDVTAFTTAEATGTNAISSGEITLTLTGSSLGSAANVTVIMKSTTTNAIGTYFVTTD